MWFSTLKNFLELSKLNFETTFPQSYPTPVENEVTMMENIILLDVQLFRFFNSTIANPFFDLLMPFITDPRNWMPIYIISIVLLLWKGGKKGRYCVLTLLITIVLSDQLSSHLIKELVGRLRPCHFLTDVRLLVPCGGGKSFPSSHAVNNFAAAGILTYYYRKYSPWYYSIALLIGFSRIYVGVHYPFDVLAGMIIGSLVAYIVILVIKYSKTYMNKKKDSQLMQ